MIPAKKPKTPIDDAKTESNDRTRAMNHEEEGSCHNCITTSTKRDRPTKLEEKEIGRVWIPEMWGQEDLLKDWIECSIFDSSLANSSIIMSARAALAREGRSTPSTRLRVQNGC